METWKPVFRAPWSENYEVSNLGNVRRSNPLNSSGQVIGQRILRPAMIRGYLHVLMYHSSQRWFARVHHLVAHAFIGEPPGLVSQGGWNVNHKNADKTDNRAVNLEWMTADQNQKHAAALGLKSRGSRHYRSILTEADVRAIRRLRSEGVLIRQLQEQFNASKGAICAVIHNRTWRHVTHV